MTKIFEFNHITKLISQWPECVEKALTSCGKYTMQDAGWRCSEDSGKLRASIKPEVKMESNKQDGGKVETGTNKKYAVYVEFGTGIYAENGKGRKTAWGYFYEGTKHEKGFVITRGQKPKPFLRPAIDENRAELRGIFDAEISALIRRL